ncbi:ROK family protein [Pacificibacter maritimus]|uniref:ROK family protein n=1 Tax=Pacificibacter maritimus TaxID=762213 RepID=UPI001FEA016C|nr:ROK family protein [Pacificibacter maritimus]
MRQQIFQFVRATGTTARADITRALQISAGSATTQTADLIAEGLLREVSQTERDPEPERGLGRGRPRVALEIVPETAHVIGIKLTATKHTAVLCDFAGDILATMTIPTQNTRRTPQQLLIEIITLIERLLAAAKMKPSDIKAVGLGMPGIVDHGTGQIKWTSLLADTDVDLRSGFAAYFDAPLYLDNDTNMLTLFELWFGTGRDKTDFAVVTIETGVGMGMVMNNRLYRGSHGMGLELGHTKVQLDGALCQCGLRGCLEAYIGEYALTREAETVLDVGHTDVRSQEELLDMLFTEAQAGHKLAESIFKRAGRYLSMGLSNVVQIFDPPLIILSGARVQYHSLYAEEVFANMQSLTLSKGRAPCDVQIHRWDDDIWAHGAAAAGLSALTDTIVGGLEVQHT